MKKLLNKERSHHSSLRSFDLKVKLSTLLMFLVFFSLQANNSYSQKTKLSLELNNVTVSRLIDEIESTSEFRFVYKINAVNLTRNISIHAKKQSIASILDQVFAETETAYNIVDRQIFLLKRVESEPSIITTEATDVNQPQELTLKGSVIDTNGQPLPGANIIEKGTTNGTQSDFDGNFTLDVSNRNAILIISYVGFKPKEVNVSGQTMLKITLEEETAALEEVVLIGYGVQKKALVTGASVQVSGENLEKMNTVNALQAMQGQTPGVQITSTSGQPGESLNVVIRGVGSTAGSTPLYVVDGILTGDISYLNNSDIESISVLKDAASAAIYGSQASNGVILVSTKKGKRGSAAQLTFDQYYGLQSVARKIDLLNATEYAVMLNEAAVNSGKNPYFTNAEIATLGEGTNWMDEMFVDNAVTQNYSLGVSGGTEASVYSGSLSYLGQEGVVGGKDLSNYERYNFRFNSEHKLYNDILTVGENLSFAYINQNGISVGNQYNNALRSAFRVSPLLPMYDADGNYYNTFNDTDPWLNGSSNPYAEMIYNNQNESNNQKLLGNVYLQIEPIKNLTFKTTLGLDYYAGEGHSYSPIYELSIYSFRRQNGTSQSMNKGKSLTWDNLLTYKFDVAENHHFETMVGSSSINYDGTYISGSNVDNVFSGLNNAWLDNTTNKLGAPLMSLGGGKSENKRMSYFGRFNYNFKDKYLLNATFRADGSSNFHPDNRWGYFPSISGGWVVTNEDFLSTSTAINFLKIRASWGQVGNQNVGAFQYLAPIKTDNTNYIFGGEEGVLTPGAYPNRLPNPDLKWETSEQLNIGLDARFFKNNLSVNFDWYEKTNKDWLILAPILATAGADAPYINGGNVVNTGVELALSYQNHIGGFNYTIAANGAYNKNEVGEIPTADGIIHGLSNELYDNSQEFYRAQDGFPLGYFWGYKTAGVFQNQDEIDNSLQPNAAPGDIIYADVNGDNIINSEDKTEIGDPNPDFTYGFTFSGNYGAFDFSLTANGVAGNQIVQSYRNPGALGNYTSAILQRWTGEGSSNIMPRVTEDGRNFSQFSDLYVQDGDFLRLTNLTFGLDLAKIKQSNKFFAKEFRIYFSALNLYTFTKYDGMDPEIGFGSSDSTQSFSSGVDVGYYPRPRTFMMGLNVKL
ncbi:TonB-dependent receptor [Aestuariibaculum sp. M13]|uniref:TonB-dependent receptor n=1 Tax=Aestuariibaculum sp. M13 TaxID=2967132 RepID=UPI002159E04D|nr:TonB-dependent receptor [Aestuariibaculum sp. M13]MCR8668008.1 TonB-dependent receptor [Aestuariibaculum sp. M13]